MITYEQTIAALEEAVAEKGEDFVYRKSERDNCIYSVPSGPGEDDIAPSCLVGYVFDRFEMLDHVDPYGDGMADLIQGDDPILAGFDDESKKALYRAQLVQDHVGQTWGRALAAAKNKNRWISMTPDQMSSITSGTILSEEDK